MAKKRVKATGGPELPTRHVLALPHWPRVAYCARLARRVLPLVAACWETKVTRGYEYLHDPAHIEGARKCVWHAEQCATRARVAYEKAMYKAHEAAAVAGGQAEFAAELAKRKPGSRPYAAAWAAYAADLAACAAFSESKPDWNIEWGGAISYATEAGKCAGFEGAVNAAIIADFQRLERLIAEKGWRGQTPVPPPAFGPLWPQGAPEGWPAEE